MPRSVTAYPVPNIFTGVARRAPQTGGGRSRQGQAPHRQARRGDDRGTAAGHRKELADFCRQGTIESDEARRNAIFNRMEDLMGDSGGLVFICGAPGAAAHHTGIQPAVLAGSRPHPMFKKL